MKKDNNVFHSKERYKSQFIINNKNSLKQSNEDLNSADNEMNFKEKKNQNNNYSTPNSLGKIKKEAKNLFFQKEINSQRNSKKWTKGKNRFSSSKGNEIHFSKLFDYRSSEFISSNKSLTFSEIEKQYNNLIENALEVSISNKDFSKMSSLRTNNVGYVNGKYGSERTNTIFQTEFRGSDIEQMKIKHRESNNKMKTRISPILGYFIIFLELSEFYIFKNV